MNFGEISNGESVFLDANTFIHHFSSHPTFGVPCQELIERIARSELIGFTSSHVLSNVAHRLMTIEACDTFNWPYTGIAQRLNQRHSQIPQLTKFRQAVENVASFGIQVLAVTAMDVIKAAQLSQTDELLSNDALVMAVMQRHGLNNLCSHGSDFDRVAGLVRYAPV